MANDVLLGLVNIPAAATATALASNETATWVWSWPVPMPTMPTKACLSPPNKGIRIRKP